MQFKGAYDALQSKLETLQEELSQARQQAAAESQRSGEQIAMLQRELQLQDASHVDHEGENQKARLLFCFFMASNCTILASPCFCLLACSLIAV